MKNRVLFLWSFFLWNSINAQTNCTQTRYLTEMFGVQLTEEPTIYATVQAITFPPYLSEGITESEDLSFDLYEPMNDTLSKRPLIIFAFGGSFLGGSKKQAEIVEYCEAMARRGFVVATIDYRLGFNLVDEDSAVRAVYRAGQDFKAAVRYFRHHAATYKIDPDAVFGGGNSAGAIAAIHSAYVQDEDRTPNSIFGPTFFVDNSIAPDWPDLGFGDSSGNTYTENSEANALLNMWGAMADLNWINAGEAPIISFHGDADNVININTGAPYGAGIVFPDLDGANPIHVRTDAVGIVNEKHVFPGFGHEVWEDPAEMSFIQEESAQFLVDYMKPTPQSIAGTVIVCPDQVSTLCAVNNPGSEYCWEVTNGTIVNQYNNCIDIHWDNTPNTQSTISVVEETCLDVVGTPAFLEVDIKENPTALFDFTYNDIEVDFDNLSIDANGFLPYVWDFGDGNNSFELNPSHTYSSIGTYTVTLSVMNTFGCTDVYSTTVIQTCQPTFTVTQSPTPSGLYKAINWVASDNAITQEEDVIFEAGDCVNLEAGFEVGIGNSFLGQISPCSN